jgi:flagellar biosynthesis protein FlhG
MRIIPIASGKGGVGKSLLAANLAIAFAQAGQRVVLADLDLGASNLHLIIGIQAPKVGVGTFLSDIKKVDFNSIIVPTDIANLRFIPGDSEIPGMANLRASQRNALVKQFLGLASSTDILVLDLGAGTHQSILDFFLLGGRGIIVSSPAVTATLNAYVFLKNTMFRMMYTVFRKGTAAGNYMEAVHKDLSGIRRLYIPQMLMSIKNLDPKSYARYAELAQNFHPRLVINMITNPQDAEVAGKIRHSCRQYLGLDIEHLGVIYRDSYQDIALKSHLPIILYKPQSVLSQAVYRIAGKILASPEESFGLDTDVLDDGFQEAAEEAALDFESKSAYVEELLHSGALSEGDVLETIKTQQLEINKLRRENDFLKYQLKKAFDKGYKT